MKVLDSDILIAITKGDKEAISMFEKLKSDEEILTTIINEHEIIYGAVVSGNEKYLEICKNLLNMFEKLSYSTLNVYNTVKLIRYLEKNGKTIGLFDEMIAGICLANNATIITRNIDHFSRVPNLKIEKW